jgi:glycerol-3-phosphate dehydrogenase
MTRPNASPDRTHDGIYDVFVIGGGVNGTGVARDAAGRGLSVILCEAQDLAQATSSASTKLFHGGLRYLEYFKFRMVRESLQERETLLKMMPHISWPLRFVLPVNDRLHFANDSSSLGRILRWVPGLAGRRPAWLLRMGLFVYDHLGGRKILPACRKLSLKNHPVGAPLKEEFAHAFEYSDCWVEDSRLVVLNACSAALHGADIRTRTRFISAERSANLWKIMIRKQGPESAVETIHARAIVNAAGPWAQAVLSGDMERGNQHGLRLVRGSHIITRRLFEHDQPYFLQLDDGRIIFAIPYERDFTLIGTTDIDHQDDPRKVVCTPEERDYLIAAANKFFATEITQTDVVASYAGVRPLYDDQANSASAATRDYVLTLEDRDGEAPLVNVFGGKITTYRRLAEHVMAKLGPYFPESGPDWSADEALPGGDFELDEKPQLGIDLIDRHPFLTAEWAARLIRAYGRDAFEMLRGADSIAALGTYFGGTLYAREVEWLRRREWAVTAEDILWRRSKLGLWFSDDQVEMLERWLAENTAG